MTLALTLENRFQQAPDGTVWSTTVSPQIWNRYLGVFDRLRVIARVDTEATPPDNAHLMSSDNVTFQAIPYYRGPAQYLRQVWHVERAIRSAIGPHDAVILRVPSQIANRITPLLRHRPYGVEVVGDPYDVFAPGVINHPLRPLLRHHFAKHVQRQCRGAAAAAYVTRQTLQQRYPPGTDTFSTSCSDVVLNEDAFRASEPVRRVGSSPARIVAVGSLDQLYKGPDVLLEAMVALQSAGIDVTATWIGGGVFQQQLERHADRLGLADRVRFVGQLATSSAIQSEFDLADLFVLPSRTEGLPRALLEAMAWRLPCLGSAVGGIPELLPSSDLVPSGNAPALAAKIRDVLSDTTRMRNMATRNFATAQEYRSELLQERWQAFYRILYMETERWIREQARS